MSAWEEYESVRGPAWAAYLDYRGPVFRYDGTETRSWDQFAARSAEGLKAYKKVQGPAWEKYVRDLDKERRAGII